MKNSDKLKLPKRPKEPFCWEFVPENLGFVVKNLEEKREFLIQVYKTMREYNHQLGMMTDKLYWEIKVLKYLESTYDGPKSL